MRGKIKSLYGTGFRSKDKGVHLGFYYPHPDLKEENPKVLEELYLEYKEVKNPEFKVIEGLKGKIKIYPRLVLRLKNYWKINQDEAEKKEGWADLKIMATYKFEKRILVWLKRLVEYFEEQVEKETGGSV